MLRRLALMGGMFIPPAPEMEVAACIRPTLAAAFPGCLFSACWPTRWPRRDGFSVLRLG